VAADVQVISQRWHTEQVRELAAARTLEVQRLNAAQVGIWNQVLAGNLTAIDVFLRLSKRRSQLLGLDMPARHQVQHVPWDTLTDAQLARLAAGEPVEKVLGHGRNGTVPSEPSAALREFDGLLDQVGQRMSGTKTTSA
jgi:hypothetical protein